MLIALERVLDFDSEGVEGTGGGSTVSGGNDTDEAGADRVLENVRDRICILEATGVFDLVLDVEVYDEGVAVAVAGSSSSGVGGYGKLVLLELVVPLVGAGDVERLWSCLWLSERSRCLLPSPSSSPSGMLTVSENTLAALPVLAGPFLFFAFPCANALGGLALVLECPDTALAPELLATEPRFDESRSGESGRE